MPALKSFIRPADALCELEATLQATAHILRAWRRRIGFTQQRLAHVVGISFTTVSRWENGHMKPSRLAWQALAQLAAENGTPLLVESSEDARERRIVSERLPTRSSA